ncbi:MAG: DUF6789 family protein [Hyphomicrobium sp.]
MNELVEQTEGVVKAKLLRALIGGFVGTILFTVMGKFVAPMVIGQPMDVAALMAPALGGSHVAGLVAHFASGTVVFPIAYLVLGIRYLPGPGWLRGAVFMIAVYLLAMLVVMPMLGQGFFFGDVHKAMVALVSHIVFGLAMGAIIGKPANG